MLDPSDADLLRRALRAGGLMASVSAQMLCECQRETQCQMCVAYNEWQAVSDDIAEYLLDAEYDEDPLNRERGEVMALVEALREQIKDASETGSNEETLAVSERETKMENIRASLSKTVENIGAENVLLRQQADRWYKVSEMYYLGIKGADAEFLRELGERG